jgi:hypothetical protein
VSRQSPYAHLALAGVQEAVLQLEMTPGGNPQTVIQELEAPLPPHRSVATGYVTPPETLRLHYGNWLPFKMASYQRRTNGRNPDVALREILDKYSSDDVAAPAADDWLFDAARLIWEVEGVSQPQCSLQNFDAETRQLPMAPTRLNKELLRTRESACARTEQVDSKTDGYGRLAAIVALQSLHQRVT